MSNSPKSGVAAEPLRAAFAARLGAAQYSKFIFELDRCRSRARLLYWMQDAWDTFVRDHPEWALTFDELLVVFRVCRVHGTELTPATVRLVGAGVEMRYTEEYQRAWSGQFPHSYPELPADAPHPTRLFDTFLCPGCHAARADWERTHTAVGCAPASWPARDRAAQSD